MKESTVWKYIFIAQSSIMLGIFVSLSLAARSKVGTNSPSSLFTAGDAVTLVVFLLLFFLAGVGTNTSYRNYKDAEEEESK